MDGRTDRRTNGQTDESDFIKRCPTNVECPIKHFEKKKKNDLKVKDIMFLMKKLVRLL